MPGSYSPFARRAYALPPARGYKPPTPSKGGGFTPASLFQGGDQGLWYDHSDLSTLWQDTAGTSPVTADGQSVARRDDKSGLGHHQVQATGTSQAKYKTAGGLHSLLFDGTDDSYATSATVNLSGSDELFYCAAVLKASDAAIGIVSEFGNGAGLEAFYAFYLTAPRAIAANFSAKFGGSTTREATTAGTFAAPHTGVHTILGKISTDQLQYRINGVLVASSALDQGTGNLGNYTHYSGRRANSSLPLNGRIFNEILRNRLPSAAELAKTETYMAAMCGVTL